MLDIDAPLNLSSISTILSHDLFLIGHILDPMDLDNLLDLMARKYGFDFDYIFRAAPSQLSIAAVGAHSRKDEHWRAATRSIVDSSSEALSTNIDMDDDTLRLACQAGEAIGHRERYHLIGTRDYLREGIGPVFLAFHDGFEQGRMVGAKVDEAVGDPKLFSESRKSVALSAVDRVVEIRQGAWVLYLPEGFEKGIAGGIPIFKGQRLLETDHAEVTVRLPCGKKGKMDTHTCFNDCSSLLMFTVVERSESKIHYPVRGSKCKYKGKNCNPRSDSCAMRLGKS